jgi:hypothetical protein
MAGCVGKVVGAIAPEVAAIDPHNTGNLPERLVTLGHLPEVEGTP